MIDNTTWQHFEAIINKIRRLEASIKQIARDIDKLKAMKEEILDNTEFKAELKKIIDVYPDATMESLIADYQRFQDLRDWLVKNNYI